MLTMDHRANLSAIEWPPDDKIDRAIMVRMPKRVYLALVAQAAAVSQATGQSLSLNRLALSKLTAAIDGCPIVSRKQGNRFTIHQPTPAEESSHA